MKILLTLLVACFSLVVFGETTNSDLSVSIALPYASNRVGAFTKVPQTNSPDMSDVRVLCRSWEGGFHVVVRNTSAKPQNIWQVDNSWGYYALSFEMMDDTGKKWTTERFETAFFSNGAMYWTLKPNEDLVMDVSIVDDPKRTVWQKFKGFPNNKIVSMRAVFEIKNDPWSKKYSVWNGRIVSDWNKYFFAD